MNDPGTGLAAEKDELLALLLDDAGLAAPEAGPPLTPRSAEGVPPLSFAQQRLWVLDQMAPGNPAYNIAVAVRLEGDLDLAALRRSLEEIVARHESLRTVFPAPGGEPAQLVLPPPAVALPVVEPPAGAEPEAWAAAQTVEVARHPFVLAIGPLLRCVLICIDPRRHVFVAAAHHIVSDGWSMGILTEELTVLYGAFAAGRPSPLPPLRLQYADFAVWQRTAITGEAREGERAYWRRQLGGELPLLQLPVAHSRPATATFAGASLALSVPAALVASLRALARQNGATLFAALLASYAALLHRYSGQTDLVIGTPVAGRNRQEIERLIGFFVNTLALRVDLTGEPSAGELISRVQATVLDAFGHQELPFEQVVEAVNPERRPGHSPLFQTLLVLQSAPVALPELPGLRLTRLPIDNRTSKVDLTLKVEELQDGGLAAQLEHNTDLFDSAVAERLAGHWLTLLAGLVAAPGQTLATLPLLSDSERLQIAARWSPLSPTATVPLPLVHRRFEEHAEQSPASLALADDEERLSYAELNREANRLANYLMSFGVGPESRVALLLDRSAAMVIALLAVLKTGAAYVPLDPDQPAERLGEMLADAAPEAVVTRERWLDRLPLVLPSQLVLLDADAGEIAGAPPENPAADIDPAHPAYVIYTSGSTGLPKGVVVSHAALANYVTSVISRFDLASCSSFALVSTPAADLGHTVLFPALATGGRLYVVSRRRATDAAALAELFVREEIDCVKIVPSHLAALLLGRDAGRVLPRRRLILGGETCSRELVAQIAALSAPDCYLANHYGPTETTVGAITSGLYPPPALAGGRAIPLERPLQGVRVQVLDASFQPVPAGVPGEVFISGAGLARGYLNDPAKTAAVFLPDPFAGPGARMYRTGDLARLLPGGELEILGRLDRQIKIQGFRVEPAEIEAALERLPGVARALVLAPETGGDPRRLVAYVVGRDGAPPTDAELRQFLTERLPAPMVPSFFVGLTALPLTANGKLDRSALPNPLDGEGSAPLPAAAGPTPVEEVLCAIWTRVLGVRQVSPHESFFDLGGHSVLATQVMARIQETFQLELPVLSLFELPTPAGLARRIELGLKESQTLQMPALLPAPHGGAAPPLSFAQQRLWFLHQLEPGSAAYNMAGRVLIRGALDLGGLERSLTEIVRRHEVLRTTFPKVAGWPSQRLAAAGPVAVPWISLASLPEERRRQEAEGLALAEARRPFDLGCGPLLRVTLLCLASEEFVLVLTLHHVVADGWSVGVILRELAQLYEAFHAGRRSPLAELPLQYSDFAVWQRQWLQGEILERQLGYWRHRLANLPPTLALPIDHPYPPLQSPRGARLSFTLPGILSERLRALSLAADVTYFMTLLAVWETLLHRYAGQSDFAVGTPIAGRNRSELEELVGFFVNTLVLRADLHGRPDLSELLRRVRDVALGAYAHQDLPFESLVETLAVDRDLARSPLFQTMFVWQNIPTPLARLSGLSLVPLESDTRTAKFELTLALQEMNGALLGSLEYNSDLFDATTAERLVGHLTQLLEAVAARPTRPVAELPLLTAAELDQLRAWSAGATADDAAGRCLHHLFEWHAAAAPDAVAVVAGERQLTYGELDAAADRLAGELARLGVAPDVPVAICVERSLEMVVGLLAVLKAGGAYVPLDPAYPRDRLAVMAADAYCAGGPRVLLTQRPLEERLKGLVGDPFHMVFLDEPPAGGGNARGGAQALHPDHLAYAIYTSGSTGTPKGVQVTHRAVVSFLTSMAHDPGLGAEDTLVAVTTLAFDIAGLEIFLPLATGARLVLASRDEAADGAALARLLQASGATVLQATPTTWRLLLESGWRGATRLRMLCGGEPLVRELAERLLPLGAGLWNLYGPTETTVWSAVAPVVRGAGAVPVGFPIANTRIHVLDVAMAPVPVGVPGEVYIGGTGLARGYSRRPDSTAERFLPDPFAGPGERLYRVGDLGRYRSDGALEILGRVDQQVKVQGVRIELGEIEAALSDHAGVAEAVVVARDGEESRRLVAYVVPCEGAVVTFGQLREHLSHRLPAAMLPTAILSLPALPRTPNGKLDRRALPVPETVRPELATALVAPRDAVERSLCEIWADVLPVDRVGIHDDFFELGGNSLLAVRLMALIERRLGVELPLSSLFRGANVAHLARMLSDPGSADLWSPLVAIQPAGRRPPMFCVHPTGGDVLCYEPLARLLGPDQPLYGLQARGLGDHHRPLRDVGEMAALYLDAIRQAQPQGPYRLSGWSFGGLVAYEMAQQLVRNGEAVALLAVLDSLAPVAAITGRPAGLDREHWAGWFLLIGRELEGLFGLSLGLSAGELSALDPEAQLDHFLGQLRRVSFLPEGAGLGTGRGFWRVHEANTVAMWEYAAKAVPYPGTVTLFGSADRLIVEESWSRADHDRPDLGWEPLAAAGLELQPIPGNHNDLLRSPNVEVLAERLADCLARAEGSS